MTKRVDFKEYERRAEELEAHVCTILCPPECSAYKKRDAETIRKFLEWAKREGHY